MLIKLIALGYQCERGGGIPCLYVSPTDGLVNCSQCVLHLTSGNGFSHISESIINHNTLIISSLLHLWVGEVY